jgi:hypothetical protein
MTKQFDFATEFVTVADYEKVAHKKIAKNALDYYKSGAGDELTLRLNTSAFDRRVELAFLARKILSCQCSQDSHSPAILEGCFNPFFDLQRPWSFFIDANRSCSHRFPEVGPS